jgi:hypothetical protein
MTIELQISDYDPTGFIFDWEEDFEIKVEKEKNRIEIYANREGLISLAKQFLKLAQDSYPSGYHLHYDSSNSLEEGSEHLIVNKI